MTPSQAILEPLTTLSTAAREPMYAVGADWRILFLNRACEELIGYTAAEIVGAYGSSLEAADGDPRSAVLAALLPPADVLQGRSRCVSAELITADGEQITRPVTFFPCHDDSGQLLAVLALVSSEASDPDSNPLLEPNLQAELRRVRSRMMACYGFDQILTTCPAMQRALEQARTAAQCDAALLVVGERGTGKELVARTIHYRSARREAPFLPIDCAALSPEMLSRTFTWLDRSYDALSAAYSIPAAGQPGTVYLEEVLALPRDFQARVVPLVQRDTQPEPSSKPRIIASTTRRLEEALADSTLREDLYYAITAIRIELPPLRERRADVGLLAHHFLQKGNARRSRPVEGFTDEVLDVLTSYDWPGNLSELAETVARAQSRATAARVRLEDLPLRLRSAYDAVSVSPGCDPLPMKLDALLVCVETKMIRLALDRCRGNKSQAADLLGISRPRLYRRMDVLGIEAEQSQG